MLGDVGIDAIGERRDVVDAPAAGPLARIEWRVVRRTDVPGKANGQAMDLAELRSGDAPPALPRRVTRSQGLRVDPFGRPGIALNVEVLAELLVPDGPTLGEEGSDLLQHEGVAFDGRAVVSLLEPDVTPDLLVLGWAWEPSGSREILHPDVDLGEDVRPAGTSSSRLGDRHGANAPRGSMKCAAVTKVIGQAHFTAPASCRAT